MGTAGFIHQLAENCAAIWKQDESLFPSWDPACLDVSLFRREVPEEKQVDGPSPPQRDPGHKKSAWLLFHLPKSKVSKQSLLNIFRPQSLTPFSKRLPNSKGSPHPMMAHTGSLPTMPSKPLYGALSPAIEQNYTRRIPHRRHYGVKRSICESVATAPQCQLESNIMLLALPCVPLLSRRFHR